MITVFVNCGARSSVPLINLFEIIIFLINYNIFTAMVVSIKRITNILCNRWDSVIGFLSVALMSFQCFMHFIQLLFVGGLLIIQHLIVYLKILLSCKIRLPNKGLTLGLILLRIYHSGCYSLNEFYAPVVWMGKFDSHLSIRHVDFSLSTRNNLMKFWWSKAKFWLGDMPAPLNQWVHASFSANSNNSCSQGIDLFHSRF